MTGIKSIRTTTYSGTLLNIAVRYYNKVILLVPVLLKVLGHSVGLCKTTKRKGKLFIILLVDVWRIICENFNPIRLILAEI